MTDVAASSGNVFADLGIDQPEVHLAKAGIAGQTARLILDQPKISALVRGRLSGFTLDRLLRFLTELDCDVEITVRPVRRKGHGHIAVAS